MKSEMSPQIFEQIHRYKMSWKSLQWKPSCSKRRGRTDRHEAKNRFSPLREKRLKTEHPPPQMDDCCSRNSPFLCLSVLPQSSSCNLPHGTSLHQPDRPLVIFSSVIPAVYLRTKCTNTYRKGSQKHNYNCTIQGVNVYTNVSANYMFRPLLVRPSSGWIP